MVSMLLGRFDCTTKQLVVVSRRPDQDTLNDRQSRYHRGMFGRSLTCMVFRHVKHL